MATFFTADPHYGHETIRANCRRPFASVEEMDAAMIARSNEIVGPDDDLWIVGDFSTYRDGRLDGVFWRLQGRKHLVVGNHDEENDAVLALPWASTPEKHLTVVADGDPVFLCHYPTLSWPKSRKGVPHLFGHMHGEMEGFSTMVDVGVDEWDFRPVTLEQAKRRMRGLSPVPVKVRKR